MQRIFRPIFNATDLKTDGNDFASVPGRRAVQNRRARCRGDIHAWTQTGYKIEDAIFVGETLFMSDYGTARADFPGRDAHKLYRSIKRLLALPPDTRLFMCHDYKAPGRDTYAWETTVREQREKNAHVKEGVTEDEFVAMREARDTKLSAPRLLLPSIQVNILAGKFPPAEANGVHYLTIPVTLKVGTRSCA